MGSFIMVLMGKDHLCVGNGLVADNSLPLFCFCHPHFSIKPTLYIKTVTIRLLFLFQNEHMLAIKGMDLLSITNSRNTKIKQFDFKY